MLTAGRPYRRDVGSISEYDPMTGQATGTPYSNRNSAGARQVYDSNVGKGMLRILHTVHLNHCLYFTSFLPVLFIVCMILFVFSFIVFVILYAMFIWFSVINLNMYFLCFVDRWLGFL